MRSDSRFWMICRIPPRNQIILQCVVLVVLLVIAIFFLERTAALEVPQIRESYLLLEDGTQRNISLPFSERSPIPKAVYKYIIKLEWRNGANTRFRVIPDDYLADITVNGRPLSEVRYSDPGRGDWNNGLIVDFKGAFRDGMNEIIFTVNDNGGAYGMNFKAIGLMYSPLRIAILSVCTLLALAIVFLVLRHYNVDWVIIICVMIALVWQIVSLAARDHTAFSFDLYYGTGIGHVEYFQYIADKGALPPPNGWSSYHPPLYYITAAGVWIFVKALHLVDPFKAIQLLSLVYYWIFLFFSLRILRQVLKQPWLYRIASALVIFWPMGFLAATRIGNDALFYPLFMMTLFYGQRWFSHGKNRDLLFASISCALGLFTKMSIFPIGLLLGCIILWRLVRKHAALSLRYAIAAILILAGSFFLSGLNKWVYALKTHNPQWFTSPFHNQWSIRLNGALFVDNHAIDFILPDTKSWFEDVGPDVWRDGSRKRSNFWNHMLKTLMHGQHVYHTGFRGKVFVPLMNIIFISFIGLACYGFPMFWRQRKVPYACTNAGAFSSLISRSRGGGAQRARNRLLGRMRAHSKETDLRFVLAGCTLLVIFCMIARINFPTPTSNDARYLLPIMPIVVLAIVYGLARLRDRSWLYVLANIAILCFILISLVFYFGLVRTT